MITFMFQIDTEECSAYIFWAEIISYLGKKPEGYKGIKSHLLLRPKDVLEISLLGSYSLTNGTSKSRGNKG